MTHLCLRWGHSQAGSSKPHKHCSVRREHREASAAHRKGIENQLDLQDVVKHSGYRTSQHMLPRMLRRQAAIMLIGGLGLNWKIDMYLRQNKDRPSIAQPYQAAAR